MFMVRDCSAWVSILSHKAKKLMDSKLSDLDLTGVQSRVMHFILERYERGPVFQRDVETAFLFSRSTATGILQLLEKKGIIRRESVKSDARLKSLVPTELAAEHEARINASIKEVEEIMTRDISPGQIQLFLELASKMSDNLDGK